ncbi:hypothetical protein ALNOE001_16880 [Candidatus Methanobinarius endosymbioticus]|uniref:Big-1 domain-containing protein n=1 Tax=Candidatus Methanobinarius endosymbioticus TaxID=2006182 RepID=A0A366M8Q9_9EURY|nr:hypothetical protein ALNOE001_16880 [Candidatus Methanobinarius endosymbioticus]
MIYIINRVFPILLLMYVNNVKYSLRTNSLGIATLNLPFNIEIRNDIIVKAILNQTIYTNNTFTVYKNSQDSVTIKLNKTRTHLKISVEQGFLGDIIKLTAKLTDHNNQPIANKRVVFTKNNLLLGTAITNRNGIATLNYRITKTGKNIFKAQFDGDEQYLSSSVSTSKYLFRTNQERDSSFANNVDLEVIVKDYHIKIKISNARTGEPLPGESIIVSIGNQVIGYGVTDSNGEYVFHYKNADQFQIRLTLNTDNLYKGVSVVVGGKSNSNNQNINKNNNNNLNTQTSTSQNSGQNSANDSNTENNSLSNYLNNPIVKELNKNRSLIDILIIILVLICGIYSS